MSIADKLTAIANGISGKITKANATTGETDTTLTDAVQSLIDGYGQGGGGGYYDIVAIIDGDTQTLSIEDADGSGRSFTLEALNATENGIYTPSAGIDGFSEVTVDVKHIFNIVPVAHETVTITGQLSSNSAISRKFVNDIYNDFTALGTDLQSYMYAISFREAKNTETCFVASSEQFFVNSASNATINIVFASSYHKWFAKTNGTLSQKEANNQGCAIGAGAGVSTSISENAGWWASSQATAMAGTYDISVYRIGGVYND